MPEPPNTPIAPSKRSGMWPADSSASHAALEEVSVLRVHDRCVASADPEELGVEVVDIDR